jgi:hypothetical protein
MLPGETILSGAPQICGPKPRSEWRTETFDDDFEMHPRNEDGRPVTVDVLWDVYKSGAGYYIGTFCPYCGPNTRESEYFPTKDEAERIYAAWLPYISDGKFDHDSYDGAFHALPYSR